MDHPYATRIRQNITLKYTSKLIDNVVPPQSYPPFPPPHVQLHPDDLNNKVFLAVARSFLTVDNRAMTIKDIAERACRYGLVCQNLSAAAQAITTYLRAHKSRCDKQQDQPLLLSHTLSGTTADDDLVPALHSRSGGDSHPTENRLTNFRKGTAVWYLSRATGAPCPFSRAGIRLCDYIDPDAQDPTKDQSTSKKKHLVERCGEKRKRPMRGCTTRGSGSDNERPPKVKLTLRLKPLGVKPSTGERFSSTLSLDPEKEDDSDAYESSSDEDSMSVDYSDDESQTAQVNKDEEEPWSLPPYPRRSISIPCYTPLQGYYPSYPSPSQYGDPYRRSPSIAYSIATPPPDSEDEADDFHITMSSVKDYTCHLSRNHDADMGWDAEPDSEGDGETMWESPGPRSPSAPIMQTSEVTVKEEPRDVQGMLDAWDDFDSTIADARVAEVLAKAVFDMDGKEKVKLEAVDPWDWDSNTRLNPDWPSEETAHIKQEDFGIDSLFPLSVPGPSSPLSPIPPHFSSFSSSPNNPDLEALRSDEPSEQKYATVRPRAKTVPVPSPFFQAVVPMPTSSFSLSPPLTRQPLSVVPSDTSSRDSSVPSTTLVKLLQSMSVITTPNSVLGSSYAISPPTPCVSPSQTRCQPFPTAPKVVVHTCQPCNPAISATQIEDISVYQMMLGAFQLLRRIDTDFVNLSPIVAYSGSPHPVLSIIANATVVTKGSPEVSGTWVPLQAAQAYVKEHLAGDLALDIFLSDALVERFPSALQDFYRSNAPARSLNQFGKPFESTLQAAKLEVQTDNGTPVSWDSRFGWMHNESSSSSTSASVPFALTAALAVGGKQVEHMEVPLSATEQEIFQELCVIPDWDRESSEEGGEDTLVLDVPSKPAPVEEEDNMERTILSPVSTPTPVAQTEHSDRPLRRSKRVADALAAAHQALPQPSRTRSRKAGSRNSLS
ncbi:hypothetical protein BYT27DRAFT_7171665 [Phlegmacium glaucopus]|nr:hypothetical protein BYT27DRAFT_7171665 [Phlegmacium glaucopus]